MRKYNFYKNYNDYKYYIFPLLFAFCTLLFASSADAATGLNRTINFQGKIVNKTGGTNISDNTYSFTFKLYDAASSGNLLWQETQSSVTVTNGIFQVALGSVTPFNGGGYNVDFKQDSLYLDITFNGETFGTRVRLAAVPQAIDAEQLSGVVATQSANTFTLTGGTSTPVTVTFPTASTTVAGLSIAQTFTAAQTIQSNASAALAVGANGATNPVLQINASTGSVATGLSITGAATGGTTALTVIDSGSNAGLSIDAKGSGIITIGGTSTGNVNIGTSTTGKTIQIGNSGSTADTIILGNSSDTALKLAKFGTQNGVLYVSATDGTVSETAASTGTQCLTTVSAGTAPIWGSCGGAVSLQNAYSNGQSIDFSQVSNTAGLTIGTATGVGNILLQPNAGGAAGLIINKQATTGDIFTASASGTTKFVLSNGGNLGLGTNAPQQTLTLGSGSNFATEMAAPSGVTTGAPTSGGTLTKNTPVFYKVTATDGVGETVGSAESNSCTPAGSTQTCPVSWAVVPNAVSYKIYRTSTSGSYTGTNFLTSVTTNSYSDTGSVALTSGTPPTATTAYFTKIAGTGASWLLGANFGIGTATPLAPLDIEDWNGGGNAAFMVNQNGANTNDIFTASASGTTKFIVHNDGSLQTVGGNATADITSITGGNGLTILPKANASGAGGVLTLKGGNGTGAAGGNVVIDAGTGSANGTVSIGTGNQSGLTLGRSGATSALNGSSITLGGATGISGALTVTSNASSSLAIGPNGSTNPALKVDSSTASQQNGLVVTGSASSNAVALSTAGGGTNIPLTIDSNGSGTITIAGTSTGAITLGRATGVSGAFTVTSNSSSGLTVGANGATNPVFTVDASTASVATGLKVLGAATGGTTAISVTDSGSNANLSIDAKGSGTITIGGTSTGNIIIGGSSNGLTFSTTTGPSYAGNGRPTKQVVLSAEYPGAVLTASNSANFSGNMTSDASPSATATYNWENYYQWLSSSNTCPTLQEYTVAVRVTLPKDFSAWSGGNALTIAYNTAFNDATLNSLDVYVFNNGDSSGTPVAFSTNNKNISKTWTTVNFTGAVMTGGPQKWGNGTADAGKTAVIYLRMRSCNTVNYVQVGDITLNYLAAF